ncbi:pseudouridine synthase [Ruminococcus albus SY3]|uniref:Pseudouridine synthase n=1 Tax=Ruminococcus albus SY3 TaxID=1341156 RepID=A0A011VUQ8_RUMAL|nr:RluA family pseudouridine synthase [Ruminococcus albus]EXM38343.1 pseudouridine synthase [Ruminococcus albus SY3]EXM38814.1 pseudouridine synthase [Ruminococcus albus SY3]
MREFSINKNDAGQRMDKFLTKAVPALPKNLMYKYIRLKRIKLNGKRCEISTKLSEGDSVQLYINDEFFPEKRDEAHRFLNAPKDIEIVYEDENILLCDKPCGLVVHEDESGEADTLIDRVLHYLYDKGEFDPDTENSFTPALCNRIDRNTSGIVICAKNAESLRVLNQKVKDRELEKLYLCVTVGIPNKKSAELKAFHRRDEKTKVVRVEDKSFPGSKTMITRYKVLAENKQSDLALLEVDLVTGRTHQIRAHLAHIGYPLLGDGKYGSNKINRALGVKTQALCSYKLTFRFTTESGCLEYLDGKSFEVKKVWFKDKFFQL